MTKTDFLTTKRFKTSETSPYQYEFERTEHIGRIVEYNAQNRPVRYYNVIGMNDLTATISIPGIRSAHTEVLEFGKLLTINTYLNVTNSNIRR